MIRHLKPSRVIEIGGGYSTFLAARALSQNGCGELICIEPYPMPSLCVFAADSNVKMQLIKCKVQDVALQLFENLASNDILFIGSSHVSKAGSDVNHESDHLSVYEAFPKLGQWEVLEQEFGGSAEASCEPGELSSGDFSGLTVWSFFSLGVGFLASSHMPVETAQ